MSNQRSRIRIGALGWINNTGQAALIDLEQAIITGVLGQIGLYSDYKLRDYVTGDERMPLDSTVPGDKMMDLLAAICQKSFCTHLLVGSFDTVHKDEHQLIINIRLYCKESETFLFAEAFHVAMETTTESVNEVINSVCNQTLLELSEGEDFEMADAIEAHPVTRDYQALINLAHANNEKLPEKKLQLLENALKSDPALDLTYLQLAKLYKSTKQFEKAVQSYQHALKVSHTRSRAKAEFATDAGICCVLVGKEEVALQWWQMAIQLDGDFINPYFNIANTLEDLNRLEEAEKYFLKAQQMAPDDFRTVYNLARLYSKMGLWDKALLQYQTQLSEDDQDPWLNSDLATCHLNLGHNDEAKNFFQKTLDLDPEGEAGEYARLVLMGLQA